MNKLILSENNFGTFQKIINQLSTMIMEVQFEMSEEGLNITAMDGAQVCMAILDINKGFFEEGSELCKDSFGLNIIKFNTILKRFKGEKVFLELGDIVKIEANKKKFSMKTIQILGDKKVKPNLEKGAVIKLKSDFLKEVVEDGDSISPNDSGITFSYKDKKLTITMENPHGTEYHCENDEIGVQNEEVVVKASYSKNYLKKSTIPGEDVLINMKNDYPITIRYCDGDVWHLDYIIAPRIENN